MNTDDYKKDPLRYVLNLYKKDPLRYVLNLAYRQALDPDKKGMQRHGDEKPFREQIGSVITRTVGLGFPLGQALKKHEEHKRLSIRTMAVNELLGAINYLAIAIINLIDEGEKQCIPNAPKMDTNAPDEGS